MDNRFDRYEKLVRKIHSRGIMINASKVFGLDGDGPDVFRRTLDWLVAHKFETLTSHILTPYPETELYRRMYAGTYGSIGSFTHSKIYCAVCRSIRRRGIRIRYST